MWECVYRKAKLWGEGSGAVKDEQHRRQRHGVGVFMTGGLMSLAGMMAVWEANASRRSLGFLIIADRLVIIHHKLTH